MARSTSNRHEPLPRRTERRISSSIDVDRGQKRSSHADRRSSSRSVSHSSSPYRKHRVRNDYVTNYGRRRREIARKGTNTRSVSRSRSRDRYGQDGRRRSIERSRSPKNDLNSGKAEIEDSGRNIKDLKNSAERSHWPSSSANRVRRGSRSRSISSQMKSYNSRRNESSSRMRRSRSLSYTRRVNRDRNPRRRSERERSPPRTTTYNKNRADRFENTMPRNGYGSEKKRRRSDDSISPALPLHLRNRKLNPASISELSGRNRKMQKIEPTSKWERGSNDNHSAAVESRRNVQVDSEKTRAKSIERKSPSPSNNRISCKDENIPVDRVTGESHAPGANKSSFGQYNYNNFSRNADSQYPVAARVNRIRDAEFYAEGREADPNRTDDSRQRRGDRNIKRFDRRDVNMISDKLNEGVTENHLRGTVNDHKTSPHDAFRRRNPYIHNIPQPRDNMIRRQEGFNRHPPYTAPPGPRFSQMDGIHVPGGGQGIRRPPPLSAPTFPSGVAAKRRRQGHVPSLTVDRDRNCPFLLRVFCCVNKRHDLCQFAVKGKEPVKDELQIYTWLDATLREITDLIKDVSLEARDRNARLGFYLIHADKGGTNIMTEIGTVHSTKPGADDWKSLHSVKFNVGDFIELSIGTNQKPDSFCVDDRQQLEEDVKSNVDEIPAKDIDDDRETEVAMIDDEASIQPSKPTDVPTVEVIDNQSEDKTIVEDCEMVTDNDEGLEAPQRKVHVASGSSATAESSLHDDSVQDQKCSDEQTEKYSTDPVAEFKEDEKDSSATEDNTREKDIQEDK